MLVIIANSYPPRGYDAGLPSEYKHEQCTGSCGEHAAHLMARGTSNLCAAACARRRQQLGCCSDVAASQAGCSMPSASAAPNLASWRAGLCGPLPATWMACIGVEDTCGNHRSQRCRPGPHHGRCRNELDHAQGGVRLQHCGVQLVRLAQAHHAAVMQQHGLQVRAHGLAANETDACSPQRPPIVCHVNSHRMDA